jgi:hypothetical protein
MLAPARGCNPARDRGTGKRVPMHGERSPGESEEFARIDGAILGLLVNPHEQRPFSEGEVGRDIDPRYEHIAPSLNRLHQAHLIHRWNGMVSATRAAVRFYEIRQAMDPVLDEDRYIEGSILAHLLAQDDGSPQPLTAEQIRRAMGRRKRKHRLAIFDAIQRLDGIGLLDRSGDLAFASVAAVRFDEIMQL